MFLVALDENGQQLSHLAIGPPSEVRVVAESFIKRATFTAASTGCVAYASSLIVTLTLGQTRSRAAATDNVRSLVDLCERPALILDAAAMPQASDAIAFEKSEKRAHGAAVVTFRDGKRDTIGIAQSTGSDAMDRRFAAFLENTTFLPPRHACADTAGTLAIGFRP